MDKAVIDTDIFSEIRKKIAQQVVERANIYRQNFGHYTISVITVLEVTKGWRKRQREDRIQEFIRDKLRARFTEIVSLEIPEDTLKSLQEVAQMRDMSLSALLKFYVGQGLRQDLAKMFGDRVIEKTAQVLSRHIDSKEEISTIRAEIPGEIMPINR